MPEVYSNMNYTYSQGVAPGLVQFYEKKLLKDAKPEMVHSRDAQKRTLPENNGKHVQFRKMVPYAAVTEPLKEGVTPAGQEIRQTAFTATVKPYGRHVEVTDELNYYQLDNLHEETAQLLSDQATLSLDTIARDAINAGMNVQYAGGQQSRSTITAGDKLTADDIKKAVRTLRRANCKPFPDGFYHAIVHPDTIYDLTSDPLWIDVAKYQDKSKVERYELGTMYKVKFFESTNAKTFKDGDYLFYETATATITGVDVATRTATLSTVVTEDDARAMTGKLVKLTGGDAETISCIERVDVPNKKITFRWLTDAAAGATTVAPTGGGASGTTVYSTVIYGENAFGDIELGGNGGNVKIIIHQPGHGEDPIEQRGTIAWKVKGYACVILQDAFIVRIEHGATA